MGLDNYEKLKAKNQLGRGVHSKKCGKCKEWMDWKTDGPLASNKSKKWCQYQPFHNGSCVKQAFNNDNNKQVKQENAERKAAGLDRKYQELEDKHNAKALEKYHVAVGAVKAGASKEEASQMSTLFANKEKTKVKFEILKSLELCVGITNDGRCRYPVNRINGPVSQFFRLCGGCQLDYEESYDAKRNENSSYGSQDKFILEPIKVHFNEDISELAEGTMVVGSGQYLGWGTTNWFKPDAHGEFKNRKFFVYEGDENCHDVNSGLLNSLSSLTRYAGANHYSLHIQWEKMLSVIYAKKKGVLFIRVNNDVEAAGLEGGDIGLQLRLNQLIWLLEQYRDGLFVLKDSEMAIIWIDGYKPKRLYNGNLRLIVIDIFLDNYENILNLASIDSNTFNLKSPAVIRYSTDPFPSPLPNIRQFLLPASSTEYTIYELSFKRLSSFLSLMNLELPAGENGNTFKELIDLGLQVNPVNGDEFYYSWFKFLLFIRNTTNIP